MLLKATATWSPGSACVSQRMGGGEGSLTVGFVLGTQRSDLGTAEACSLRVRLSTSSRLDHSPS